MARITVTALRTKWQGRDRWLSDGGSRGAGRLLARLTREGWLFYYKYFHGQERRRLPLGPHDEAGAPGLTLVQARDRAAELSVLYRSGVTDLHGHFEREREAEALARKAAEEAARQAELDAQRGTLRQLLEAYIGHLERQGKQAAGDVRSILTKHMIKAEPELVARKAADLTVDDFVGPIGRLVDAGKGNTARKLRAYLRAPYELAIRSRTDPDAPLSMRAFGITANPVASIGALSRFNRARDRTLSAPELAAYLKRLDGLPPSAQRDALQLALLLGGQRPAQLLRARPADIDPAAATITLYDGKGARTQPRRHVLPLTVEACAITERRLHALAEGEPLFSTDGKTCMRLETLSEVVPEIAADMVKAKEARAPFQLRDVRRTAETMLAALGVSRDVRAQLQSHGLGGIQQRHYDKHDYMLEKRRTLERWARHLKRLKAGESAAVVPMRGKRAQQ